MQNLLDARDFQTYYLSLLNYWTPGIFHKNVKFKTYVYKIVQNLLDAYDNQTLSPFLVKSLDIRYVSSNKEKFDTSGQHKILKKLLDMLEFHTW